MTKTSAELLFSLSLLLVTTFSLADDVATSKFFTTSDNVDIHYLTLGDQGSYVMLLHGFSGSAGLWARLGILQTLSKDHRVVAIDLRDHGESDKTVENLGVGENFDLDAYEIWYASVLEVEELLDYLKIEKAHIHGYSSGADFV